MLIWLFISVHSDFMYFLVLYFFSKCIVLSVFNWLNVEWINFYFLTMYNLIKKCHVFSGKIVIDFVYLCSRWTNNLLVYGRLLSHVSTFISSEHLHTSLSNLCRCICILSEDVFYVLSLFFILLHSLLNSSKFYKKEIKIYWFIL